MALLFEHKTCGRCGGSGKYSFNMMHGSTCYGCNGRGQKLTRRGHMAQEYFTSLLSKRAADVVVGEKYYAPGFAAGSFSLPSKWCKIESIGAGEQMGQPTVILTGDTQVFHASPDTILRIAADAPTKQAAIAKALAYQATLSATGKPLKRALQAA